MTNEEYSLIKTAIDLSRRYFNGGVTCLINQNGDFLTNYVPFRQYFREHDFTGEHKKFAIEYLTNAQWKT